ncbi:MAG: TRAM domain-containing protein, partial [Clostridiales bacterium]|nr:TRAM domain-containing protein [Clostridiales bacterium]
GETADNFKDLYDFVRETKFDRLGVFPYSQEEGTPAASMPNQVKPEIKQTRLKKIMELQQKIHFSKQRSYIGKILPVIIDTQDNTGTCTARTQYDAYEVDAVVTFLSEKKSKPGQIVPVKIIDAFEYDLRGVAHESSQ